MSSGDYLLSRYDYDLPEELVAQAPVPGRDTSRLLVLDRATGRTAHRVFSELPEHLPEGALLVRNNTAVVPGRLFGHKETGGRVEVLIADYAAGARAEAETGVFTCECLVRASKSPRVGARLVLDGGLVATVREVRDRLFLLAFEPGGRMREHLDAHGRVPLPPYIRRENGAAGVDDRACYQTVYAAREGAVAAPTAGLHFTPEVLAALERRGVAVEEVTLHVGYGTFMPVRVDDYREHRMHAEWVEVPGETARAVSEARREGRPVVAVGTTTVRSLEWAAESGEVRPRTGPCALFITPGHAFRAVDAMVTNFHLPRSTLLLLVSAFAGRESVLAAYREAVRLRYRFFSYGDAMLIA